MTRDAIDFEVLVQKAKEYLREIASAIEQGKKGELEDAPKDALGYGTFLVDVGLALYDLPSGPRMLICQMIDCIERGMIIIAKEQFRRKHGV